MPEINNPLTLRVYWEDTDAGGVVYYANYLKFFERARTEWLRGLGVAQAQLQAQSDCIFVVADVNLRYFAPARLDDTLIIGVKVLSVGRASIDFAQQAWRDDTLLAQAQVRVGCVNAGNLRPRRIPDQVLRCLAQAPAIETAI